MEHRSCWAVTGRGKEHGGGRAVAAGPGAIETDAVVTPPRPPYPVSLAMESGTEHSLREAVRQLVEGAI